MLKAMRDSSQSVVIYVLFGLLVFVFAVNFGPGSSSCGGADVDFAARVDGDVIRREDFAVIYRSQYEYRRSMGAFGAGLDDDRLQNELRKQVIDELIETRLLSHEARRLGMTVTDEELLKYLETRYKVSEVDFDQYESWVARNFGTTTAKFEHSTRGDIIAARLGELVRNTVSISDEELKDQFLREHDRAMVTYVRFNPRDVAASEPSAQAIDALLASDMDGVKARFDQDLFKYRTPEQRQARQILVPLAADASDADVAAARSKLIELKGQVEGGADFAGLATQHSGDAATKGKGGDLGQVERGHLAKPLEDALFALGEGQLSEPTRSPQGLHLLQVVTIKPPGRQELADVQRQVAADLLRDRVQHDGAKAQAEKLRLALAGGANVEALTQTRDDQRQAEDAAREAKKTLTNQKPVRNDSAWVLHSDPALPGIGENASMHEAIFAASKEASVLPTVYEVGRYVFVVQLKDRETPDLTALEKDKEKLREDAVWSKRSQVYRSWVKHLRSKARVELNPELFNSDEPAA